MAAAEQLFGAAESVPLFNRLRGAERETRETVQHVQPEEIRKRNTEKDAVGRLVKTEKSDLLPGGRATARWCNSSFTGGGGENLRRPAEGRINNADQSAGLTPDACEVNA